MEYDSKFKKKKRREKNRRAKRKKIKEEKKEEKEWNISFAGRKKFCREKKRKTKKYSKGNIVSEETGGFHLTTFPGEVLWETEETVAGLHGRLGFLRRLNSHPTVLPRKRSTDNFSESPRDDTRPCFSRTTSDDSTTWWSLKPRERCGTRGQPPLQREI